MFEFIWLEAFAPFTFALILFFAFLALEIAVALMGGTFLGLGSDAEVDLAAPDADIGDFDFDLGDFDGVDLDAIDADALALEGSEFVEPAADAVGSAGDAGLLAWLGLGRVPMLIWIAFFLVGFGLSGMAIQMASLAIVGVTLPVLIVCAGAGALALWSAKSFGALFARILPKTETTALSERRLGRRRGVITVGVARRGSPAEVRVTDHHNNTHYIRAEPLKDDAELPQGTEVLVLRATYDGSYFLVELPG